MTGMLRRVYCGLKLFAEDLVRVLQSSVGVFQPINHLLLEGIEISVVQCYPVFKQLLFNGNRAISLEFFLELLCNSNLQH